MGVIPFIAMEHDFVSWLWLNEKIIEVTPAYSNIADKDKLEILTTLAGWVTKEIIACQMRLVEVK
jgi:hypothetical protein